LGMRRSNPVSPLTRLRPATPDHGATGDPGPEQNGAWLDLFLQCPNCGGPIEASPHDVTRTCAHCRSLLLVKGKAADVWIQRPVIRETADIAKFMVDQAVAAFDIERRTAADQSSVSLPDKVRIGMYVAEAGPPAWLAVGALVLARELYNHLTPELADGSPNPGQSVEAFRTRITERTKVLNLRRVLIPFSLCDGAICRVELDRGENEERRLHLLTERLQRARVSYPEEDGLGDLSLQVARISLVRPDDCDLSDFDWVPVGRQAQSPVADPSRERSASPTFDRTLRDLGVCVRWEATVYRPYVLANVKVGRRAEVVLIDAATGLLAGRPTESAVQKVRRSATSKAPAPPLGALQILPSRCPNCGSDLQLDPRDIIVVCGNCRTGVEPGASGLSRSALDIAPSSVDGRATYLPFWRIPFSLSNNGEVWSGLQAWSASLRAAGLPKDFTPRAPWLLIPAMPWLNSAEGDRAFVIAARGLHRDPPEFGSFQLPEKQVPKFYPVRLGSNAAKGLARGVLAGTIDEKAMVHLNPRILEKFLLKASLVLEEPRLCYVGFDNAVRGIRRGTVELPARALELEA